MWTAAGVTIVQILSICFMPILFIRGVIIQ